MPRAYSGHNELIAFDKAKASGFRFFFGVDEAGRGPLAGPVVAAAVLIKDTAFTCRVGDSKALSEAQREKAFAEIHERALVGVGIMSETVIDEVNILRATHLAMTAAVKDLASRLSFEVSQVLVPPAMHAILSSPTCRVQSFLAAGHVCAVMGYWQYPPIAEKYRVPITITGFEPLDLAQGILLTVRQLENNTHTVENAYTRAVTYEGNRSAQAMIERVFAVCDRNWRGIGLIPQSGWCLRREFSAFDAEQRFQVNHIRSQESPLCIAGEVLQGIKKPANCPAFGKQCTPQTPLGAPMVSSEGACAAYYRYGRDLMLPPQENHE